MHLGRRFHGKAEMRASLHKKIYSKDGITEAASAFQHLCDVEVAPEGDYFRLDFKHAAETVRDSLLDEFANYALFSTIARKKRW